MKKHIVGVSSLGIILVLLVIFLPRLIGFSWKDLLGQAVSPVVQAPLAKKAVVAPTGPTVSTNTFFIKLKSPSALVYLDALNKKNKIVSIKQSVIPSKQSLKDAPIFSWYTVTLPFKSEVVALTPSRGLQDNTTNQKIDFLFNAIKDYKNDPNVVAVTPAYIYYPNAVPNDTYYSSIGSWGQPYDDMWGLKKINAETAWDQSKGSSSIIVANIDSGLDGTHPDIQGNVVAGWDFCTNKATTTTTDNDGLGHGTHTAGTIGAVGNNAKGVTGLNWVVKIMPLTIFDTNGNYCPGAGASAVTYAADNGARVTSNSWGGYGYDSMLADAFRYAHGKGVVSVAAAGNSNVDALNFTPASLPWVITVSATDYQDQKASFSNWGGKIDVAAPGVDILSLHASGTDMYSDGMHYVPTGSSSSLYYRSDGTSMATPHVAGLAALLLSKNTALTPEGIRQIIRAKSVDLAPSGKDNSFGYGRIDANQALSASTSTLLEPIITSPGNAGTVSGAVPVTGSIVGPKNFFASYTLEYGLGEFPTSWIKIQTSTKQVINGLLGTFPADTLSDGSYAIRLTALSTTNQKFEFTVYNLNIKSFSLDVVNPIDYVSKTSAMPISGMVTANIGTTLASYTIEYGSGANPTSWSAAGITLQNGGTQQVTGGTIGTWNTAALADGPYTLRVIAKGTTGKISLPKLVHVNVDSTMVPGWPKLLSYSCFSYYRCDMISAFGDLFGDGKKELVTASANMLHVFKKDGTEPPGFPIVFVSPNDIRNQYYYNFSRAISLADMDTDGKKEIIVPVCIYNTITQIDCTVRIFTGTGVKYPGWIEPLFHPYFYYAAEAQSLVPAIADLNGDGKKEVVFDDGIGSLHAYQLNGAEIPGFPVNTSALEQQLYPEVSIADMNKDGKVEIAVAYGPKMALFSSNGTMVSGWPITIPAGTNTPNPFAITVPTFADLYGDGNLEIVEPVIDSVNPTITYLPYPIYAWDISGNIVSGWPKLYQSNIQIPGMSCKWCGGNNSAIALDLNNDGKDEIAYNFAITHSLFSQTAPTQYLPTPFSVNYTAHGAGDINADGHYDFADMMFTDWEDGAIGFTSDTGSAVWKRKFDPTDPTAPISNRLYGLRGYGLVTDDMDNNGNMEVAGNYGGDITWPSDVEPTYPPSISYLWEVPLTLAGTSGTSRPINCRNWPMVTRDPARTSRMGCGFVDTTPPNTKVNVLGDTSVTGTATIPVGAMDVVGVSKVELYYDSTKLIGTCYFATSCANGSIYSIPWDTTGVTKGLHYIVSKAYDAAGNTASSVPVGVSVY